MRASGYPGHGPRDRAASGPRRPGGSGAAPCPRLRFDGWIAGAGTSSGTRIVLGHWKRSPFGTFSDVMLERADGERLLLAPTSQTAAFIRSIYAFDTVHVVSVDTRVDRNTWTVTAGPLDLRFTTGRRGPLGLLLRAVPDALAERPAWATLTDLPARLLPAGVRTRGRVGGHRRQWYCARDLRPIVSVSALLHGVDLGGLEPVAPAVRFGFGSVPRSPAVVRVTTTVESAPQ